MVLKNNLLSIVKTILFSIITFVVLISIVFIANMEAEFIPYLIIVFFIFDFPAWYLFFTYYLKAKDNEIHIEENQLLVLNKSKIVKQYALSEIEGIEFFKSKSEVALHPSMNYSYIKVKISNDKYIYITCLMTSNLPNVVKSLKSHQKMIYGIPFLK